MRSTRQVIGTRRHTRFFWRCCSAITIHSIWTWLALVCFNIFDVFPCATLFDVALITDCPRDIDLALGRVFVCARDLITTLVECWVLRRVLLTGSIVKTKLEINLAFGFGTSVTRIVLVLT